jgi:hypothetical protein
MRRPWSRRQLLLMMSALGGCIRAERTAAPSPSNMPTPTPGSDAARCTLRSLRRAGDTVEVEVVNAQGFPVQNELPTLRLGSTASQLSRYADGGDLRVLIFSFPAAEFAAISDGATAIVYYGEPTDARRWDCAALDKRLLPPS